jgi:hypothetical protein
VSSLARGGPVGKDIDPSFAPFDQIDGYPVRILRFKKGRAVEETTIGRPIKRAIKADRFEVPNGYKRITMDER